MLREPTKELIAINTINQTPALLMTSEQTKNLVTNRTNAIVGITSVAIALVVIITAIVLGTTGVFTIGGAVMLGLAGGIFGSLIIGAMTGGMYYISKMWSSFSWADKKPS